MSTATVTRHVVLDGWLAPTPERNPRPAPRPLRGSAFVTLAGETHMVEAVRDYGEDEYDGLVQVDLLSPFGARGTRTVLAEDIFISRSPFQAWDESVAWAQGKERS